MGSSNVWAALRPLSSAHTTGLRGCFEEKPSALVTELDSVPSLRQEGSPHPQLHHVYSMAQRAFCFFLSFFSFLPQFRILV